MSGHFFPAELLRDGYGSAFSFKGSNPVRHVDPQEFDFAFFRFSFSNRYTKKGYSRYQANAVYLDADVMKQDVKPARRQEQPDKGKPDSHNFNFIHDHGDAWQAGTKTNRQENESSAYLLAIENGVFQHHAAIFVPPRLRLWPWLRCVISFGIHSDHLCGNECNMAGNYDFIKVLRLQHLFSTDVNGEGEVMALHKGACI